ncbi:MAG TPA: hypothetical protein VL282_05015 [Tepidisphaeraceae bacterium]|jgi:hypothetical protein|nr:hypothetical protein [Tepidisphaeraceae bacterium]
MSHQDAYVSDIVVVITDDAGHQLDDTIDRLKAEGLQVQNVNKDQGVIEGSCPASKVKTIDHLPGVSYVRSVFTYVADYPPGDPRDLDGQEDTLHESD